MQEKLLLIKTKDKRQFLTFQKNLPFLIEFAKTFGAELHYVSPEKEQEVLELKLLTTAICDSEYKSEVQCKKLEKVYPKTKKDRSKILSDACKIRAFVTKKLLEGKPVSLKDLKTKYKDLNLTDACLCNHLAAARKSLVQDGYSFKKTGAGSYCLVKS